MIETRNQRVSLVGQVIEDLTFEALSQDRFKAELQGLKKVPAYKPGGFFVFSDLQRVEYFLRVCGERAG
jgi:hypothetical protein